MIKGVGVLRKISIYGLVAFIAVALIAAVFLYTFDLSALPEPGRAEFYLATQARRFLVHRSAKGITMPAAAAGDDPAMAFSMDCAPCHGDNGSPLPAQGRWMNPRATRLGSPETQRYSDAELFWVIKDGIRLTGMPGFEHTHTDAQIAGLVRYIRSLPAKEKSR